MYVRVYLCVCLKRGTQGKCKIVDLYVQIIDFYPSMLWDFSQNKAVSLRNTKLYAIPQRIFNMS